MTQPSGQTAAPTPATVATPPAPRSWWRRNRIALLVVVVLLPATLAITFAQQWLSYFDQRPSRPVDLSTSKTVDFADTGWRIVSTTRVAASSSEGADRALPPGTDLVSVTVDVTPHGLSGDDNSPMCTVRLEDFHGTGEDRSWSTVTSGAISLAGNGPDNVGCDSEESGPYSFTAEFVVPPTAGSDSDLALSIAVVSEFPDYLRLTLPR
ncbi:hypothetical protein [Glaciihabitans sp. dw_435]|uniref:hypothetical protein n=1 Tax=Glaciihabitans sp. dw_435 TaxID=2720081 RepID=UPI001BD40EE0|nr:hypothetical protein [Glaciihabitans sp. dw_435]